MGRHSGGCHRSARPRSFPRAGSPARGPGRGRYTLVALVASDVASSPGRAQTGSAELAELIRWVTLLPTGSWAARIWVVGSCRSSWLGGGRGHSRNRDGEYWHWLGPGWRGSSWQGPSCWWRGSGWQGPPRVRHRLKRVGLAGADDMQLAALTRTASGGHGVTTPSTSNWRRPLGSWPDSHHRLTVRCLHEASVLSSLLFILCSISLIRCSTSS